MLQVRIKRQQLAIFDHLLPFKQRVYLDDSLLHNALLFHNLQVNNSRRVPITI